jgi:hypothetical protein
MFQNIHAPPKAGGFFFMRPWLLDNYPTIIFLAYLEVSFL